MTGRPGLPDLVAGGAQRGDVVRAEVLHLVDEHGDALAGVGGQAAEVGQQLDQVDLDVAGVGPAADGRHVDARAPAVPQLGVGARVALGERAEHAEGVVGLLLLRVAELADRLVQRARQRLAEPLVGARLELAGPPAPADRLAAQRVEQDGLADAAQSGEDQAALGAVLRDPLEDDVERAQLLVPPRELGRTLAGAGRVRVPDRVHARTVSGCLADSLDFAAPAAASRRY